MKESYQPLENAPSWFLNNINHAGKSRSIVVNERMVHFLQWNEDRTDLPALVLVHGFGAHANWWSFLAPFFIERYRIVALDLPGMGDSEPPAAYEDNCFARAIVECVTQLGLQPVIVVGHSFGGAQSLRAMAMAPHLFRRGIVVDSNVRLDPEPAIRRLEPKVIHKRSQSRADCMARFRLVPPQPGDIEALVHYIAFHSCRTDGQGWFWKADPNCINVGEVEGTTILQAVQCRVDLIYGENSFLNVRGKPGRVLENLSVGGRLLEIPGAGHHIMVDYPLELVSSIKALLSEN